MTVDLSGALRQAIALADPVWVDQPSHVRQRLIEVLGSDARGRRAEIHQLVVAAEERIPLRLRRDGWTTTRFAELTERLVATRGWTTDAAAWAVMTWALALDLATEPLPTPSPSTRTPTDHAPSTPEDRAGEETHHPGLTLLPSELEPESTRDGRSVRGGYDGATIQPTAGSDSEPEATFLPSSRTNSSSSEPNPPEAPRVARDAVSSPPHDASELPRRGTTRSTRRAADLLGEDIDVAYEAKAGASPLLLLLATPIGLAAFAFPLWSGVLLLVFILIVAIGSKVWPTRLIAFRDNDVWVLRRTTGNSPNDAVVVHTTREHIRPRRSFGLRSIEVGGVALWLQYPHGPAARSMPVATGDRTRTP